MLNKKGEIGISPFLWVNYFWVKLSDVCNRLNLKWCILRTLRPK